MGFLPKLQGQLEVMSSEQNPDKSNSLCTFIWFLFLLVNMTEPNHRLFIFIKDDKKPASIQIMFSGLRYFNYSIL